MDPAPHGTPLEAGGLLRVSQAGIHVINGRDKWITRVWKANKAEGSLETFRHSLLQNKTKTVEWTVMSSLWPKAEDIVTVLPDLPPGAPDLPFSGPGGPWGLLTFPGAASHFCARASHNVRCTHPVRGRYPRRLLVIVSGLNACFYNQKQKPSEHLSSRPASRGEAWRGKRRSFSGKLGGASGRVLVPLLA